MGLAGIGAGTAGQRRRRAARVAQGHQWQHPHLARTRNGGHVLSSHGVGHIRLQRRGHNQGTPLVLGRAHQLRNRTAAAEPRRCTPLPPCPEAPAPGLSCGGVASPARVQLHRCTCAGQSPAKKQLSTLKEAEAAACTTGFTPPAPPVLWSQGRGRHDASEPGLRSTAGSCLLYWEDLVSSPISAPLPTPATGRQR